MPRTGYFQTLILTRKKNFPCQLFALFKRHRLIYRKISRERRSLDKFYFKFKSMTRMQLRKRAGTRVNLWIYIFALCSVYFSLIFIYTYACTYLCTLMERYETTFAMEYQRKIQLHITKTEKFPSFKYLLTLATKMNPRVNERGKGGEFVSQMSFPFSQVVITATSLEQFRVIRSCHDSHDTIYNVIKEWLNEFFFIFDPKIERSRRK